MKLCRDKRCKRRDRPLPLSEFGKQTKHSDGKHSYCRECMRRRVREYRERLRAQKKAHRALAGIDRKPERKPTKVTDPFSMVYQAISKGLKTREEIRKATRVDYDTMGEILTELVWECKVVKIENNQFVMVEDLAA